MKTRFCFARHHRALLNKGMWLVLGLLCLDPATAEEAATEKDPAEKPLAELSVGRDELKIPGIRVRIKERYVDVDSKVCLDSGMLELSACTKDSKEHESLIAVEAKAAHIHAALLLIGARPGNPATSKQVDGEQVRWIHSPPRGQNVDVFLVVENKEGVPTEYPISHFLTHAEEHEVYTTEGDKKEPKEFPTNTFLFAGSHVFKDGESEPVYLSDESGNVISISTFGDELLCLPGFHEQDNEGLVWEVDSEKLPPLGSKVILRLKPQFAKAESPDNKTTNDTRD